MESCSGKNGSLLTSPTGCNVFTGMDRGDAQQGPPSPTGQETIDAFNNAGSVRTSSDEESSDSDDEQQKAGMEYRDPVEYKREISIRDEQLRSKTNEINDLKSKESFWINQYEAVREHMKSLNRQNFVLREKNLLLHEQIEKLGGKGPLRVIGTSKEIDYKGISEGLIPEKYCCPLTLLPFRYPVVTEDGHTYERDAIERAYAHDRRSPLSREPMQNVAYPNRQLVSEIKEWVDKQTEAQKKGPK